MTTVDTTPDASAPVTNEIFALRISELSPRRKVNDLARTVDDLKEQVLGLHTIIGILGKTVSEQSLEIRELKTALSTLRQDAERNAHEEEELLAGFLS